MMTGDVSCLHDLCAHLVTDCSCVSYFDLFKCVFLLFWFENSSLFFLNINLLNILIMVVNTERSEVIVLVKSSKTFYIF